MPLPDAVVIRNIGRTAVIAVTGAISTIIAGPISTIIAGPIAIIARTGERAPNDGAADQSGSDASGNPAATGFGGLGSATADTARVAAATITISFFFMASPF